VVRKYSIGVGASSVPSLRGEEDPEQYEDRTLLPDGVGPQVAVDALALYARVKIVLVIAGPAGFASLQAREAHRQDIRYRQLGVSLFGHQHQLLFLG